AEEVMQRVRVRLWQQFAQYDDEKSFAGWARAIAYYVVLAYRKEKSRRIFSESVIAELKKTYDDVVEDVSERHEALLSCLNELPAERQELVVEYYSNHGAVEKVAEKIGLTTTALRQSIYRIRKKLHQCIQLKLDATI
ncbi:MAG: sigma-70 family RNA polymerase sigma factor, partial [Bythopirellula sp.]